VKNDRGWKRTLEGLLFFVSTSFLFLNTNIMLRFRGWPQLGRQNVRTSSDFDAFYANTDPWRISGARSRDHILRQSGLFELAFTDNRNGPWIM
jgi:hypothetical protein